MLNKRKQLYHYRIERVLKEYNNILLYQHSGLNTKKWRKLREELLQISIPNTNSSVADQSGVSSTSTLNLSKGCEPRNNATVIFIKDRMAHLSHKFEMSFPSSILEDGCDSPLDQSKHNGSEIQDIEESSTSTMYRGPLLLIGCVSHRDMVLAHNTIAKQAQGYKYTVLLLGGLYHRTELNPKDLSRLLNLDDSVYTSFLDVAESPLPNLTQQLTTLQHNLLCLIRHIG
jgi:hypothetical protein